MNSLKEWVESSERKGQLWVAAALVCSSVTLAALYAGSHADMRYQWQKRNTIVELRELPLDEVKVRGVVTYVDFPNKRFWLQDETGAIAINQNPIATDTRVGDVLLVEMRKTHVYDPTVGSSSLGLSDFKVDRSRRNAPLPLPVKVTIPTLSEEAKTGIRVTVEGVIHSISAGGNGLAQVYVGDQGQEVQAFLPGDPLHFAPLLNA